MFYHHLLTTVFEYFDEIIEIELTIAFEKCMQKILGSLENKDSSFRTIVISQLFSIIVQGLYLQY